MVADSPAQRVFPMMSYEDVGRSADWLCRAFGFREVAESRYADADGTVTHAEVDVGGGRVMLGCPGPDYRSPVHHAEVCAQARRWLAPPHVVDGVLVHVDDVDGHCARAGAAGATILRAPTTEPYGRLYVAADSEGHRWMFMGPTATG